MLTRRVGIGLVMRVAVALAVAKTLHQLGRGVAQAHRHRARPVLGNERARRVVGNVDRIALRRAGEIDHRLGQRQLAFRRAQPLVGRHGIERELQRARVGEPDVLGRHADHAPPDVERVGAAIEHAAHPVQRGVGIAAAHGLVQGGDLVVERFAALVEQPQRARDGRLDEREVEFLLACFTRRDRQLLGQIDQPAPVAVGVSDQGLARRCGERNTGHRRVQRPLEQLREFFGLERLQHVHGRARQQRVVDLERRVLRRRADERDQAALDEGQEGVLLRLVEAVHFVDEEDGVPSRLRQRGFGVGNRVADVLDARQHRRNGDEVGVERIGHQPRQRRLADARRAPQDHRMRLLRREGNRERLAGVEQVALADDFVDRLRPQALRERRRRIRDREQISR